MDQARPLFLSNPACSLSVTALRATWLITAPKNCTCGPATVSPIGDDIEQVLNAMASDPCHDSELGKMRADRIDHGGLLPD
jgi:hypothetical protein